MHIYIYLYKIECFPCLSLFPNKKVGQKVEKASGAPAVRWFSFLYFPHTCTRQFSMSLS